jgi:hypothetical protein
MILLQPEMRKEPEEGSPQALSVSGRFTGQGMEGIQAFNIR